VAALLPAGAVAGNHHVEFTTSTPTADVNALTGWALERGVELDGLRVSRPSLEDVFLSLAGAAEPPS
jgi:ABC-2 type transport system ATP-binding protein